MTSLRPTIILLLLSYFISPSYAFTFFFTSTPTQCSNMTVEWTGGQAPFTLLLVPTGHLNPETRTIIQKDIPSGNSISFILDLPAQSQFVAVLNDATGIGTGGTSVVTTVQSSSDSSCLSTTPSQTKFFLFLPSDIGQCDSIDISWGSQAQDPIDILALIPGGQSFEIANVTDSSSSVDWTADVRSGEQIMFVAGDKDGLGTGGSSDVLSVSNGDGDSCISDSSPSSTSGPAAGGVSSTTQAQSTQAQSTQTTSTSDSSSSVSNGLGSTQVVTSDNAGSTVTVGGTVTTDSQGSTTTIVGPTGVLTTTDQSGSTITVGGTSGFITTTDNAGSTVTVGPTHGPITTTDNSGSTITLGGGPVTTTDSSGSTITLGSPFPGSGGGTVTGSSGDSSSVKHSNLGLILGIVFGLLALLGLAIGGILLYRRRQRNNTYRNLETGTSNVAHPHPWVSALTRGAHIRGGAGSSVDTLPSMYQTEPFILPSEHQPYYIPHPQPPPPTQQTRPNLAARASSSRSIHSLMDSSLLGRDAFGGVIAGVHGSSEDSKESIGPHGRPPSRSASGRVLTQRTGMPPPTTSDPPTRVTRDSEDFYEEPEEVATNPFDDSVVEIPPTYASVRRASRSSHEHDREAWHRPGSVGGRLVRSNASRYSRRSTRSDAGAGSNETG